MSTDVRFESTRRRLNGQQAETVERLTSAAVEVLRENGPGGLSVRTVASRAGVAPATAYTYFSSKGHLIAEVFWRRLEDHAPEFASDGSTVDRVVGVLRDVALLIADEPELSSAVTAALLGDDPEVSHLRMRIGVDIRRRLVTALGDDYDDDNDDVISALEMVYAGALVRAGMGYGSYSDMADAIESAARLILR
ncbi:TetR/AcrR family transcriptional regulator [Dietzia aerolata]|mgnify:CR=1 FL=1|uniref:TetR/AcrR family transcriptional regulator n=1 Tax=Dietzia aerolata TaxID=595984 RepID=A0ABV5JP97_9ACTN|nr:TetR/AcrR family transcriptional regulator [Dietzia aerolata]MBB0969277.1 TetR/AcrR family transcriptional regulator [Dietzia aerolata]HIW67741.1 TetR/AcrR family transcriptional regulator [Candidatus Dietzia merdigallinarum]